jgi:hypothetical protein
MSEAAGRSPETGCPEAAPPADRRLGWWLGCGAFAVLAAHSALSAWCNWDWEAAAFVAGLLYDAPASVLPVLLTTPGSWWLADPLLVALGLAGSLYCLLRATGEQRA